MAELWKISLKCCDVICEDNGTEQKIVFDDGYQVISLSRPEMSKVFSMLELTENPNFRRREI